MNLQKLLWLAVYEGEGDGNNNLPPPKVDPPPVNKTFTQDEVNRLMAENKKNLQRQNQEMATQLETLKQNANLTKEERDELATRIDTLQQQYLSKEELARQAQEKKESKYKQELESATTQAKSWQERHNDLFKSQVITQAAADNGAFSTKQMLEYFSPRGEIVPQMGEDGKPTGQLLVVVPIDVEKDGKVERVKLPVPDAVKTMKTMPQLYGNFFKGEGSAGLGLQSGNTGQHANGGKIEFSPTMSEADYAKWRKQEGIG